MALNDTLFRLGLDVARSSSPAQKEDATTARASAERADHFVERDGVRHAGTHLIIDLHGARRLDDIAHVERTLKRCVEVTGASLLHIHLHHFGAGGGVAGMAVLAESHIGVHTWPEADYAALDVFMCGDTRPELAIGVLQQAFDAKQVLVTEHLRGKGLTGGR